MSTPTTPRTDQFVPEPKSRRFARAFVIVFIISSVATFIWGYWIVDGVRGTAAETDRRIRTVAWATLAFASENGRFPQSDDELLAYGGGPESISVKPSGNGTWPTTRAEAMHGDSPDQIADCLRSVLIVWGDDGAMPPLLTPNALPTMKGTETEVNRWLDAFRHRADGVQK